MATLMKQLVDSLGASIMSEIPQAGASACSVPQESFSVAARVMKESGGRLAAEWGEDESPFGRGFRVWAAYHRGDEFLLVSTNAGKENPSFATLTAHYVAAYRFERQILSLMGIQPVGHPDTRPWIRHEDWPSGFYPLRKSANGNAFLTRTEGEYPWIPADGKGVYEIPVGPVHAGIIEPGHFRFQAVGERILNLEAKLGYVHKGIEKKIESLSWEEAARLAGRVSGDTTVAHALGFCMAVESLCGVNPPPRAHWLRALLLERERIMNHLADLAALCNDVAFTFGFYQFWNLRERMLRTNQRLFSHRFMMDRIVTGGILADVDETGKETIREELDDIMDEFERIIRIVDDSHTVKDRFFNTGRVSPELAEAMGMVGFAGKASGQNIDMRISRPFPPYDRIVPKVHILHSGDVHARAWVRVEEVRDSSRMVHELLEGMPEGQTAVVPGKPKPDARAFAGVEGWRGEILYWIHAGPDGGISRCMVRDPSSVNWLALEQAIKEDMVPDFPLANKSFNNSYSGNDL